MSQPLRVLLVEDSVTDAKLIVEELRKNHPTVETERVEDARGLRLALQRDWDIVISDWALPSFSAPAALLMVREFKPEVPFIIVSGTIGEETAVEAMRAGANDYVLKDHLTRLDGVIERELRESQERVALQQAKTALRESEARFARLSESGIVGIVYADVWGNTLDANETYLKLLGYTREEVLSGGLNWATLTPPEWHAADNVAVEQLQATGVAQPWEKELFRKDGSRVGVLVGVAMLEYPKVIVFIADLTAQRRAEHALRQSEDQLRQAQKMEAIGRLAGGVAHDFNNVLSVILGYSDMLLADLPHESPMRRDIQEIRNAGQRAAALTRQLLLFSRQQVVEPRVLDLNDVLSGMDKMLQRILGEDIELVTRLTPDLGRIKADPGFIEQVVMNLVVNARDAMPTGGQLTIETMNVELDDEYVREHFSSHDGAHVMLAVTDTGVGMDDATKARIFEPFFTTKEKSKGTGLGLSTVFGIIEQSQGHIWVYSEPGQGTTFKIYLPRVDAQADSVRPLPDAASLYGGETILLVENESEVLSITNRMLSRYGYRVLAAGDPETAIRLCQESPDPIDLLLTDVVMPKMSGPEVARKLVALRPSLRVLYMSGFTDDSVVRHGLLESSVHFIQKPITPELLARKVREVLEPKGGHA